MDIEAFWANPDRYTAQNASGVCPATVSNALLSKADELSRTWQTTGFYTWEEMSRMLTAVLALTRGATTAAEEAGKSCRPCGYLVSAGNDYFAVSKRANDYVEIVKQARSTGAMIDSPGFKPWIISMLRAGAKLMREAEITSCTKPFWLGALRTYVGAAQTVADVALAIGKGVVAIGQAVVSAGDGLYRAWPYIKWGGIALGAVFASVFTYNKLVATAESGYRPINWGSLFRVRKFAKPGSVSGYRRR